MKFSLQPSYNYEKFNITSLEETLYGLIQTIDLGTGQDSNIKDQLLDLINLIVSFDQSVIIGITDRTGTIIYVNDMFCKISQYNKDELLGNTHRLLNSGHQSKDFFKKMWETITSGQKWEGEIKNKAKDGSLYWVKTAIIPIPDASGKPTCFISIRTDITEGKVAQEQLYIALQEEYRQTVDALDIVVFKIKRNQNGDKYFSLFAGNLAEKLGYNNADFYNKTVYDVFKYEDAENINQYFKKVFQEGTHQNFKYKKGEHILLISLSPIFKDDQVIEIVGNVSNITDLEHAQDMINHMAFHDTITNLPNQRLFELELEQAVEQWTHGHHYLGILCLRLNGLGRINESFGYEVGQRLLCSTIDDLKQVVKKFGALYRSEGSRFYILTKQAQSIADLEKFAECLQREVERPREVDHHEFKLTCSIGASAFPDGDGCKDSKHLVNNANKAMRYSRFKVAGNYKYYTREVHEHYKETLTLEDALKKALYNNELELYYQPKIDIHTNRLVGAEALIRWNSKDLGFVSPMKFIPIAEEMGLILSLGNWVLKQACKQSKEWLDKGYKPLKIAVNVSPLELQHSLFISNLKKTLETVNLDPSLLEVEITESSMMSDTDKNIGILMELQNMGISIAIDDFGTGFSSLSYLKKFPVNSLKIDQTFIRDVLSSTNDSQLVLAMINIARTFKLSVIAEGVETEEVLNFLRDYGCEQVQGYFFDKPLPVADFEIKYLV
ncbi:sensor domain-containing protein [Bacillus sp. Marseille-P3661]|uniref:sensor domain-containing protein n=1 Tax=Bacillus sp. Marseille-P3661 TaxID=1936234 RepID=UPI000C850E8E|nr:EAL domain-containing protein [Bacillus sp. Marseille-P3661]